MEERVDFRFIESFEAREFIAFIRMHAHGKDVLDRPWAVSLDNIQQVTATKLNILYSKLVWGTHNSASNYQICNDERHILSMYLENSHFRKRVLEVGCGSGRLTDYIGLYSDELLAIDVDDCITARVRLKKGTSNVSILTCDFQSIPNDRNFTCILLCENLIGMVPILEDRKRYYETIENLLEPRGIAIICFRVPESIDLVSLPYHILPYNVHVPTIGKRLIVGTLLNWTVPMFLMEVRLLSSQLKLIEIYCGERRPAGGKMYSAIFERT